MDDNAAEPVGNLEWRLDSSNGWQHVAGRAGGTPSQAHLVTEVTMAGGFWDRERVFLGQEFGPELVPDFTVKLPQVLIGRDKLADLRRQLLQWLEQPREIRCDLAVGTGQEFTLSLRVESDIICSMEKPVCTVRYSASQMTCQWKAVVDQSCIRLLAESIRPGAVG
jgi:hypothetical protein